MRAFNKGASVDVKKRAHTHTLERRNDAHTWEHRGFVCQIKLRRNWVIKTTYYGLICMYITASLCIGVRCVEARSSAPQWENDSPAKPSPPFKAHEWALYSGSTKTLLSALVWVTARSEWDGQHTWHGLDAVEKRASETVQLKHLRSSNRHHVSNYRHKIIWIN